MCGLFFSGQQLNEVSGDQADRSIIESLKIKNMMWITTIIMHGEMENKIAMFMDEDWNAKLEIRLYKIGLLHRVRLPLGNALAEGLANVNHSLFLYAPSRLMQ